MAAWITVSRRMVQFGLHVADLTINNGVLTEDNHFSRCGDHERQVVRGPIMILVLGEILGHDHQAKKCQGDTKSHRLLRQ